MKHRGIVTLLAFASMFFAILMPPEAFPAGTMAITLAATFAFLIAISQQRIPPAYLRGGIVLFILLGAHTWAFSVDFGRSLEFMPIVWAYYCLLGYFMYAGFHSLTQFAVAVVVLSAIVSGYGIYQYFWGFEQLYNYIAYSGSDEIIKTPALMTIESERVFSTLALPGTLWGFLVLALPIHGMLWRNSRPIRIALIISMALLLACGLLTRSFGFLVGIFVLTASALIIQHREVLRRKILLLTGILVVLVILGSTFYSMRQETIEQSNPFALRFMNWLGAWNIFAVNPIGTGLNTFAVAYPKFMLPGSNETQYAHNTPLQIMSELGYPAILAFLAAIVFLCQSRRAEEFPRETKYLTLALIVWTVHNMIDINVYFPSLGVMGVILIGTLLSRQDALVASPSRRLVFAVSLLAITFLALAGPVYISNELQHRADIELENGKIIESLATLDSARKFNPLNSSLYHASGETSLELFHKTQKQEYFQRATESFRRATELSPLKVGPHIGLGLCFSTANNMDDAFREIKIAQQLYPNSDYVRSIEQLMQRRINGEFSTQNQ